MDNRLGWYQRLTRLWARLNDSSAERYAAAVRLRNFGRGPAEGPAHSRGDRVSIPSPKDERNDSRAAIGPVVIEN